METIQLAPISIVIEGNGGGVSDDKGMRGARQDFVKVLYLSQNGGRVANVVAPAATR